MDDPQGDVPTQRSPGPSDAPLSLGGGAPSAGRYEVREELGRGGMGVVYRAHDRTLGRDVALKVLRVGGLPSTGSGQTWPENFEAIERFQREVRAAAGLDHPNIIKVLDVGRLPLGEPYYTMDLLHGEDVADAIHRGHLSVRDAVEAIRQVSLALLYAHQKGILHRDIKPQNIFLRRAPGDAVHALLLDFGLAKLADRDFQAHAEGSQGRKSMQSLTRSGEIFGTPAYMPPEQTRGAKDVDSRADIYSLGAALYHAPAGKPPFDAVSLAELLARVQRVDAVAPSVHNREVDPDLDTIALKCLQKDPEDRYQNAGDLAEECRRWLAGEPIAARPIGPIGRVWRRAKRNRAFAIPVAALSLLLLLGLLTWVGVTVQRQLLYRQAMSETRALLGAHKYPAALDRVREALGLFPDEPEVKDLVARIHVARGTLAARDYQRLKREVERLEREEEASGIPLNATEEQARVMREADWRRTEDLKKARRDRGRTWSEAIRPFHEALTFVLDHAEAKRALAELYWDEYVRNEALRERAEEARYQRLVEDYGDQGIRDRLRGEKAVRVSFLIPVSCPVRKVFVWLFQYAALERPPVLVPRPFDPDRREAFGDAGLGPWEPVPLDEALATLTANDRQGGPDRVARVRWGSAFPLQMTDRNRVVLEVDSPSGSPARATFRRTLPRGSYLLYVPRTDGLYETRYPFEVLRERDWDETCELVADDPPPLPPGLEAIPGADPRAYWVHLLAGPYRAGGDRDAQEVPLRKAMWRHVPDKGTQGVFMARFEVTTGMYRAYINDATWHKSEEDRIARLPRESTIATKESLYWEYDPKSGWRPKGSYAWWADEVPIISVSWYDAEDFCEWLTRRAGGGAWAFGLPSEDEWERAARGPDGRFFPWGDRFDAAFCRMNDSRVRERKDLAPEPVGLFGMDESPFGVREMTSTASGRADGGRIFKGGAWSGNLALCRSVSRDPIVPQFVIADFGFRLIARRVRH